MKEKNGLKKTLAVFLVVVLLLTTAPLAGFVGLEFPRLNFGGWLDSVGEWFEETKVFEDYIVGKDAAGVTGIATVVNEEGHSVATDADADLLAGCTISISTFQEAVAKACNNAR